MNINISLLAPFYVGELKQLACGERSRTFQSITQQFCSVQYLVRSNKKTLKLIATPKTLKSQNKENERFNKLR